MTIESQKYYQKIDSLGNQIHVKDRLTLQRNKFKTTVRKIFPIKEGFAGWRIDGYTGLFLNNAYTVCTFDTKVFRSVGYDIRKTSDNKFYVGKSGIYEFNSFWRTDLNDNDVTKCLSAELWIGKNGITSLADKDNFVDLDFINMHTACTAPSLCEDYFDVIVLQGTKHIWLDKNSDYIEIRMLHTGTLNINDPDSHHGFVEIKFITDKVRVL